MIAMRSWVARSPSYQTSVRASVDEAGVLIKSLKALRKRSMKRQWSKLDAVLVESLRPLAREYRRRILEMAMFLSQTALIKGF